ncbi:MAG: ATP-binding protein [Coriobacteriales bacterium]|jgi:hypothetical protein|nr:ATP-binding protein [Coriobacteriales bacterium]
MKEPRRANPFHPQFGKRPDKFVGRDNIIRDFVASLSDENDPWRTTVVTGIRGSGKTSLLSGVKEAIAPGSHAVVDVTAGSELNQSILDQLQTVAGTPERALAGINVGALGFSVGLDVPLKDSPHGFRHHLTQAVKDFAGRGQGVVFLIDEMHNDTGDAREFAITYQHLVREGADVALLMAGLPHSVSAVLNDKVLTFLHRAHKVNLTNVSVALVSHLYARAFKDGGFAADEAALRTAAGATFGFPYLIQLVGYYLWKNSDGPLSFADVDAALLNSKIELFQNVYELMLREISPKDQEFLFAMLDDREQTAFGDLTARLGVSSGYASRYRQRLIESGFVAPVAHGVISLTPPYIREFLESQRC